MLNVALKIGPSILEKMRSASDFIFDVDLTITHPQGDLAGALGYVIENCGKRCGIATGRALDELDKNINRSGSLRSWIFKGPVILENGALVIRPGESNPTIFAPLKHVDAITSLRNAIKNAIIAGRDGDPYGSLPGISDPQVQLPPYKYQASLSLWQRPLGDDEHFERVMVWVNDLAKELGIRDLIELREIGDGTLRASIPGRSKGAAIEELAKQNLLDPSKVVFFCDGHNDLPAAQIIRSSGGTVACVDRHCKPLMDIAHYVAPRAGSGPDFVLDILRAIAR